MVYPPNQEVSHSHLGDARCDTVLVAVCRMENNVGRIQESYSSGKCCVDVNGWHLVGSNITVPESCSIKECMEGKPAHWKRTAHYKG